MSQIKRDMLLERLIAIQLNMINKTIMEALIHREWKEWTITKDQYEYFKIVAIGHMQKVLKINKRKATEQFEWFMKHYGLTIKQ